MPQDILQLFASNNPTTVSMEDPKLNAAKQEFERILKDYLKRRGADPNEDGSSASGQEQPKKLKSIRIGLFRFTNPKITSEKIKLVRAALEKLANIHSMEKLSLLAHAIFMEDRNIEESVYIKMEFMTSSSTDVGNGSNAINYPRRLNDYLNRALEYEKTSRHSTFYFQLGITLSGGGLAESVSRLIYGNNPANIVLAPDAHYCRIAIDSFCVRFHDIINSRQREDINLPTKKRYKNAIIRATLTLLVRVANQTRERFREILINAFLLERRVNALLESSTETTLAYFSEYTLVDQSGTKSAASAARPQKNPAAGEIELIDVNTQVFTISIIELLDSTRYSDIDLNSIPKPTHFPGMTKLEAYVRERVAASPPSKQSPAFVMG